MAKNFAANSIRAIKAQLPWSFTKESIIFPVYANLGRVYQHALKTAMVLSVPQGLE